MPDDRMQDDTTTTYLAINDATSLSNASAVNVHNNLIQMNLSPAKYSVTQGSIVDIKDWNLLEHNNIQFSPGTVPIISTKIYN